jgi:hypothetical protein
MRTLNEVLKINAELETSLGIDSTNEEKRLVKLQQYRNFVELVEHGVIDKDRFDVITKNSQKFRKL